MKNVYPKAIGSTLIVLFLAFNTAFSNASTFVEYSTPVLDTIVATQDQFRKSLIVKDEGILSVCRLEKGVTYQIQVVYKEEGYPCQFQIHENNKRLAIDENVDLQNNRAISFTAKESCTDFKISNLNCIPDQSYKVWISFNKVENSDPGAPPSLNNLPPIITFNPSLSEGELIRDVFIGGGCFDVTNVTLIGSSASMGKFENGGATSLGMDEGVALTTGRLGWALGPNDLPGAGLDVGGGGDPDLDILTNGTVGIQDASGIEFDFEPTVGQIQFVYAFASEEYPEYVCSGFNDVFGFFISGPGIGGIFSNGGENIALIPGTTLPVAINTVNNGSVGTNGGDCTNPGESLNYSQYYVDNTGGQELQYDGIAGVFTAVANVIPCETYHIRLVVGDGGDGIFDSAVFLQANSFQLGDAASAELDMPQVSVDGNAYEGCADGAFVFNRQGDDLSQALTIPISIDPFSTATEGVDFTDLPDFITIQPGETTFTLPISIFSDNLIEGVETIFLRFDNTCVCNGTVVELFVQDQFPLEIQADPIYLCGPELITIAPTVIGGVPFYEYQWDNGWTTETLDVFVSSTTTYSLNVSDQCGNQMQVPITVFVNEPTEATLTGENSICGTDPTSFAPLQVSFTGQGPWTIDYTIDGVPQPTIFDVFENPYTIEAYQPGFYELLTVSSNNCEGTFTGDVAVDQFFTFGIPVVTSPSCPEDTDGTIEIIADGGVFPYSYEWDFNAAVTDVITEVPPGMYNVTITDAIGCTFVQQDIEITLPEALATQMDAPATLDCNNANGGNIDLTVDGGTIFLGVGYEYVYTWSNGATVEDLANVPAGVYTVTVEDFNGCTVVSSTEIQSDIVPPAPVAEAIGQLSCANSAISLTGTNSTGSGTLSYQWLDAGMLPLGTAIDQEINLPGIYTLIVTNGDNGCTATTTIDVNVNEAMPTPVATAIGELTCANENIGIQLDASTSSGQGTITYQWLSPSNLPAGTGANITAIDAGTYTLIITDSGNGCTATTTIATPQNVIPPTLNAQALSEITCADGNVILHGSSQTPGVTYQWFDNANTMLGEQTELVVTAIGTYTLLVTDTANGCTAETTVNVNENLNPPVANAGGGGTLSCETANLTLTGNGMGAGTLTYEWLNPSGVSVGTGTTLQASEMGTYTFIVTDGANGCTAESPVAIALDENVPVAQIAAPASLSCATLGVDLDASGSSGNGPLTYVWNNGTTDVGTGPQLSVTIPGTYNVIITDTNNGCTATAVMSVQQNITEPIPVVATPEALSCTSLSTSLSATGSTGIGTLTYSWLDGTNTEIGTGESIDVLLPGTYTLVITDGETGCTAMTPVVVAEDVLPPVPDIASSGILTCADIVVNLDAAGSTGTGNLNYTWTGPGGALGSEENIDVMLTGDYTLVITNDINGCTAETVFNLTENITLPLANIDGGGVLSCGVSSLNLNGNGSSEGVGYSYQWLNPSNAEIGTSLDVEVTEAGTYTLIVTNDINGCTQFATTNIIPDVNLPIAEIAEPEILTCDTESIVLNASGSSANGPIVYSWMDANGTSLGTDSQIEVTQPGNYTVTILDQNNGCPAELTVAVLQNIGDPVAEVEALNLITCTDEFATIQITDPQDNYSYNWLDAGGTSVGSSASIDVNLIGTYTLVVTDNENGCTTLAPVEVTQAIDAPIPDASISAVLNCLTSEVELDASGSSAVGPLDIVWESPTGETISNSATATATTAGTYTLILTDENTGCTTSAPYIVAEDFTPPIADAGTGGILTCAATDITLNGGSSSGGDNFTYQWLNETNVEIGTDISATVAAAGTYTLIVTNNLNGCTAEATAEIIPDVGIPNVNANVQNVIDCNNATSFISGSSSQGAGNLTYEWNDATGNVLGTEVEVEVSMAGNYTLIITDDANGCTAEQTVAVLDDFVDPIAVAGEGPLLTCEVTEVELSGGGSSEGNDFSYQWLNPSNIEVGTNINTQVTEIGIYTLIVTDDTNGCTTMTTTEVSPDEAIPTPNVDISGILNCDVANIQLNGNNSTGNGALTYEWLDENQSSINTADNINVTTPGNYTLIITDGDNGCTAEMTVAVLQDIVPPVANAGQAETLTCNDQQLTLNGMDSSIGDEFIYRWVNENNQEISTQLDPIISTSGTYTLMVTNTINGCTSTANVDITENFLEPQPLIATPEILTCSREMVVLDANASSGIDSIDYSWSTSGASLGAETSLEVTTPGIYELLITDKTNGCTAMTTMEVTQNLLPPVSNAGNGGILTCAADQVPLNGEASSIGNNFTYEWLSAGGVVVGTNVNTNVNEVGIYTLVVTNTENGCTAMSNVQVTPDENLPTANAGDSQTLTCDILEVDLIGEASSNGMDISYLWLDANNNVIGNAVNTSVEEPGTYTIVVTDGTNGCTSSSSVEIMQNIVPPIADAGSAGLITCVDDTAILSAENSSANGALSFVWTNPAGVEIGNTEMIEVGSQGTYSLLVTAENGCTSTANVEVSLDADVPIADPGIGGTLTCLESNITLGGASTSSGNDITYQWLDANNQVVGTTKTIEVTSSGLYTLLVNNSSNNCSSSSQVEVFENTQDPIADIGNAELLTCENLSWTLGGTTTSTGDNITYRWQTQDGVTVGLEAELTVSDPDTYTLLVTDMENGCTAEASIEVLQNIEVPQADAGSPSELNCDVNSVLLDGGASSQGGNFAYEWLNDAGVIVANEMTTNVAQSGDYILIVTNTINACSATAMTSVTVDTNVPVADPGIGGTLTCLESNITLGGANTSNGDDIIYQWLNANNQVVGTTKTIEVTSPGLYTLMVIDSSNDCNTSSQVEVFENTQDPIADIGNAELLTCENLSWILGGTTTSTGDNITYRWQTQDGVTVGVEAELMVNDPDTYTLLVTDMENGCTAEASIEVLQNIEVPQADAGLPSILTCDVSSALLDGGASSQGGNFAYEWLNDAGVTVANEMTTNVAQPGNYILIVTNTINGCSATAMTSVTPDENLPFADAGNGGVLNCNVDMLTLNGGASTSVSGNINYEWLNPVGTTVGSNVDLEVTEAGIYTLVITDPQNGCSTTAVVEVEEDYVAPIVDAGNEQILTCSDDMVALTGMVSNAVNLIYEWQNSDGIVIGNTAMIEVMIADTYTLMVTDQDNGCTATSTVSVVPDTNLPIADAGTNNELNCTFSSISLSGTNSSVGQGFEYQWLDESGQVIGTTIIRDDITEPGMYTLIVTDTNNDCSTQDQVLVTENIDQPIPAIDPLAGLQIDCDNTSLVLDGIASEPAGSLIFEWSTIDGNIISTSDVSQIELNAAGEYVLLVTNTDNGCSNSVNINIAESLDIPQAEIAEAPLMNCNINEITLDASNSSITGNFEYQWQGPNNGIVSGEEGLNPIVNAPGLYSLTIINEDNGCSSEAQVNVTGDFVNPNAIASVDDQLDCITETVELSGLGSSSGANFNYQWSGQGIVSGANGLNPTVNTAGDFQLIVTDENNGCSTVANILVEEDENIPDNLDFITEPPSCHGEDGELYITSVQGGSAPYLYALDGGSFFSDTAFASIQPGTYSVMVEDATGCQYEEMITVPEIPAISVIVEPVVTISLGETHNLDARLTNIPNSQIDTIIWFPTDSLSCIDCLNPIAYPVETTTYTITVINENGCVTTNQITIKVDKTRNIYIPNAFTPNGDSENDVFLIYSDQISVRKVNHFQVYNRWGEMVFQDADFQPNDPSHGWKGTFRGQEVNPAVFVYWAEIEFIDGVKKLYKGDVTVLK